MTNLVVKRVLALPAAGDLTASTMYIVRGSESTLAEVYFTGNVATDVRHVINKAEVEALIAASTSSGADKLTTARKIAASGDASWEVTFDGSGDVTAALTLAASGVTAGDYPVVTVDAKGRVTGGRALLATDIPAELTSNTSGNAATADLADAATVLATARTINGVAFDGSANIEINAVDSTARIASSEKGVANGVATLDASGLVPSSQLPSYVDDVLEFADFAALPATGESSKIYVTLDNNYIYRWTGTVYLQIPGGVGMADAAVKLATARTIAATGDATWEVSFDGTANVSAAITLAASGITAGEHAIATYDAKGRAVSGRAIAATDLPADITSNTTGSAGSVLLAADEW